MSVCVRACVCARFVSPNPPMLQRNSAWEALSSRGSSRATPSPSLGASGRSHTQKHTQAQRHFDPRRQSATPVPFVSEQHREVRHGRRKKLNRAGSTVPSSELCVCVCVCVSHSHRDIFRRLPQRWSCGLLDRQRPPPTVSQRRFRTNGSE